MSGIAASFRFVVGLAMLAGGATLVAPLASRLAAAVRLDLPPPPASGFVSQDAAPAPMPGPGVMTAPLPGPPAAPLPPVADFPPLPAESTPAPPPQADYLPPTPPTPLPPLPAEFAMPSSQIDSNYRSTLDVPPPPLLDAQAPPPLAAGWTVHGQPATAAVVTPAAVPPTYRVRDGDDLMGIAARFYGHPAAAAAVWSANREVIADPGLLPIGAVLRLPPPESLGGFGAAATGGGIEPALAPAPTPVAGRVAATAVSVPVPPPWLGAAAPAAPAAAPAAPVAPRTVRVAPGETLESLARRFYGDPAQAGRIWEANRDRLRSPELVVPGMDLRLP